MVDRKQIYYWKSDRPHFEFNLHKTTVEEHKIIIDQLIDFLKTNFIDDSFEIAIGSGQGDHLTYILDYREKNYFIRLDNSPEKDDYMLIESYILKSLKSIDVPVPKVFLTDVSREDFPFGIQVMEYIPVKDLNTLYKSGTLDVRRIAFEIGSHIARWQTIQPNGFGLFQVPEYGNGLTLEGYHNTYQNYFYTNLERHTNFLSDSGFISTVFRNEIIALIDEFQELFKIQSGCLVHKDLALWNILGYENKILGYIDWSDAISGDTTDDISLLGCFHSGEFMEAVISGYTSIKELPENFELRFWLHLLRNIVLKAVIRIKGNYFQKKDLFLVNKHSNNLKQFTQDRLKIACLGLKGKTNISDL